MIINYKYRIAEEKDIRILESSDVKFHYLSSVRSEIVGYKALNFLWIIMENEKGYVGYARCKKISGWWMMEGLYIRESIDDIWAAFKLTRYTIDILCKKNARGILSWTDSPSSGKAKIFLKHNFRLFPLKVYRFILYQDSIIKFKNSDLHIDENWKYSVEADYKEIMDLSKSRSSFVNNIIIDQNDKLTKWFVYRYQGKIKAAICWWKHEDLLEIHFTLSEDNSFDCMDGLIKLIQIEYDNSITILKINLEFQRFTSLSRLLQVNPCTYSTGVMHYLLKRDTLKN